MARKRTSRTVQWGQAAADAVAALEALQDVQAEYQDWFDGMPENLQGSTTGEKLEAVCEIDIETALETANEAEGADLPYGFGRD